ncbi:MAG TPA: hypothetical protein VFS05_02620, partial [Gemmatimonadaceae bacterium]|nr:hypothetical protein [Gemmatimonadaceae bacterium]
AVPVTVLNAPPVLGELRGLPTTPIPAGTVVRVSAAFSDAGALDTHTGSVVWSTGARAEPAVITEGAGAGTITASKALPAGIHTVTLRVADDDGGSAAVASPTAVVVYDPAAGFVTAGGWLEVPGAGARPRGVRPGRVRFDLEARYRGTTPTGKLELKAEGAGLEFESTRLRWLVVAGGTAWCEGEGKVNGRPGYHFTIVATDGDGRGGRGDLLRVRITGPDGLVFDTGTGALDAGTGTPLGGGSITVHR